jgi:hypothetical protein
LFQSILIGLLENELEHSTNVLSLILKSAEDYRDSFEFNDYGFFFDVLAVAEKLKHDLPRTK